MNCLLCTLFMANKFDLIWFALNLNSFEQTPAVNDISLKLIASLLCTRRKYVENPISFSSCFCVVGCRFYGCYILFFESNRYRFLCVVYCHVVLSWLLCAPLFTWRHSRAAISACVQCVWALAKNELAWVELIWERCWLKVCRKSLLSYADSL